MYKNICDSVLPLSAFLLVHRNRFLHFSIFLLHVCYISDRRRHGAASTPNATPIPTEIQYNRLHQKKLAFLFSINAYHTSVPYRGSNDSNRKPVPHLCFAQNEHFSGVPHNINCSLTWFCKSYISSNSTPFLCQIIYNRIIYYQIFLVYFYTWHHKNFYAKSSLINKPDCLSIYSNLST